MYDIIAESERIAQDAWNYQEEIDRVASKRYMHWNSYFRKIDGMSIGRAKYLEFMFKDVQKEIDRIAEAKWNEKDPAELNKSSGLNFQYDPETSSFSMHYRELHELKKISDYETNPSKNRRKRK